MKRLILGLAFLAGLALASSSYAQIGMPLTIFSNNIAGATATNVNYAVSMENSAQVAVQVWAKGVSDANTNTLSLTFGYSLDNANWHAAQRSISFANTGTTAVNVISNWNIGAVKYIRLSAITNATLDATTDTNINLYVAVSKKPRL
jgi:hypothetical protein